MLQNCELRTNGEEDENHYLQGILRNSILEGRKFSHIFIIKPFHFEMQIHIIGAFA
jgi:hypothetical protein